MSSASSSWLSFSATSSKFFGNGKKLAEYNKAFWDKNGNKELQNIRRKECHR